MAYLQQLSGLTGRKNQAELKLKSPYGVLGKLPLNTPVKSSEFIKSPEMASITSALAPEAVSVLPGITDGGGSMGSPPSGSLSAGQAAVQSANSEQNAMGFGKGALGVGAGIAAPAIAEGVYSATNSVPAALGTGLTLGLLGKGHPALGIASLGFSAAAQSMAQADMADAIDSGEMDESDVGLMNSLSSNVHSGAEMVNMDEIGPKATKAIASTREARNNPLSFIGQRAWSGIKSGTFGKDWSEASLMDNMAKESLTPGSTEGPDRGGTLSQPQTLSEDNTYSNIGPAVALGTIAQNQDMADAEANLGEQAAQQAANDAQTNSVDQGYFSGDPSDAGGGFSGEPSGVGTASGDPVGDNSY